MGNANDTAPTRVLGGPQLSWPGHSPVCVSNFLPSASGIPAPQPAASLAFLHLELMSFSPEMTHKPRKLEDISLSFIV